MSIRSLLSLLSTLTLAVVFTVVFFSSRFLETRILALLPPDLASATGSSIHLLVFEQFLITIGLGLFLAAILFWLVSSLIVSPLHRIIRSMSSFSADGIEVNILNLGSVPKEITTLATVFTSLTQKVASSHEKDSEISRVKSDFISTAAHQLRTPLTGIRWALEALEQEQLTPDQKVLVKSAVDKSHDLVAIVGTLLDISSIESGKYKYIFEPTDISTILEEVSKDLSVLAQKSSVALFYAKQDELLPKVNVDRDRIKWILNNLVENAIRYTPAQGTVRLSCDTQLGKVNVRVSDTGIGIQEKDRANIFERFYRAGNAIAKENQGSGLGLYIARTIATDHGGDLTFIANTSGPGTTFVLSLPIVS